MPFIKKNDKAGRPALYNEKTKVLSFVVPESKYESIKLIVRAMLKSYEKK